MKTAKIIAMDACELHPIERLMVIDILIASLDLPDKLIKDLVEKQKKQLAEVKNNNFN
jgi:hypothetical protein